MDLKKPSKSEDLQKYLHPESDRKANKKAQPEPVPREKANKTIRLYRDHNAMLREVAHRMTTEKKVRVTESDIIAEALDMYCATKGIDLEDFQ